MKQGSLVTLAGPHIKTTDAIEDSLALDSHEDKSGGNSMASSRESFNVGDIQCVAISDGTFAYPTNWIFSNVPPEELEGSLREHDLPSNQVVTPYTCLLVKTGKHKVLIDTGADGLAPTTGDLLKQLQAEGTTPEEITTVVLTHAHPDHIGGALDANRKPAFPNARYVMSRTEWNFWTSIPTCAATEWMIT